MREEAAAGVGVIQVGGEKVPAIAIATVMLIKAREIAIAAATAAARKAVGIMTVATRRARMKMSGAGRR